MADQTISFSNDIEGTVAAGSTDSGNPVKVGLKYNTTAPALSNGQRGDMQGDNKGNLRVTITTFGSDTPADLNASSDTMLTTKVGLWTIAMPMLYNGTSWDRLRGDTTNGAWSNVTKIASGHGRTLLFATITQGAAGTTSLVSASAPNKVKVVSYLVVMDAAGTFKFNDGTSDLTGAIPVAANGGASVVGEPSSHLFETGAVNRALSIITAGAKAFGHLSYFLEP